MLLEIYILFCIFGVFFTTLALLRKDMVIAGLLASVFFGSVALSSFDVQKIYCDMNTTSSGEWSCYEVSHQINPIAFLWGGLAVFMFFYSIVMTFWWTGTEIQQALEARPQEANP